MAEILKPNDIFVATVNNPQATTYDLMSLDLNPENTSLMTKDEYKNTKMAQDLFKTKDGKFDDLSFNHAYNIAAAHYVEMSDQKYLDGLNEIQYSPFDITRPKDAKTYKIEVEFGKDYNPFKQLYSRSGINSIDDNQLSLRELAQQSKVFDPKSGTWSESSANDLGLIDKFFGDTLVYAQWDEDGTHIDPESKQVVKHSKGDWKVNDDGNLYLEKLAGREIYGKQVVNPMDMLTTDGSFANQFDFMDSDSREKSIVGTTFKIATEIAPFLIPGFNVAGTAIKIGEIYGGIRAAVGLSSVLPTFYKSLEGMILGETKTPLTDLATAAEGYMSKFTTTSISDKDQESLFNYEQLGQMVTQVFSQLYEQRAMASLSKVFTKSQQLALDAKKAEYVKEINDNVVKGLAAGKITIEEAPEIAKAAMEKLPELKAFEAYRSGMAKNLSLAYMAMTQSADIYGEALASGYDRRTAGIAALTSAAGQYGIMVNNRMGDWMLDKTTGYTRESNKAMMRKALKDYMEPFQKAVNTMKEDTTKGKFELVKAIKGFKNSLFDIFTSPTELGEAMFKNAFIEGVEEVTEQAVLDATKGMIDTMSYLGITKAWGGKQGSFGGTDVVFSKAGFENYLANFIGGIVGGAMFEFNTAKLEPMIHHTLTENTKLSVEQLIANGHGDELIEQVNKTRNKLGNNYLASTPDSDGNVSSAKPKQSQADLVADMTINAIKNIQGIMQAKGLDLSDKEVIKRAMLDAIVLKDLKGSKDDNNIGIEGVIVNDFRKQSARIIDLTSQIESLSKTDEDKTKNSEIIKELQTDLKDAEQKLDDIKSGKNAEKYFTQALFYLSKPISENWLTIDRVTYTKNKYDKDYYSLRENGIGITKESIEKEWKDYLENKNLRRDIDIATSAYLELEKEMSPSTAKYGESGYSEERKKTVTNLLNIVGTLQLFDASSKEKSIKSIENYLRTAKEAEIATGKRIIPWDVINHDIAEKIFKEGLLTSITVDSKGGVNKGIVSDTYLNGKLELNGEVKTRKEIISDILNLMSSSLPAEAFVYNTFANEFNKQIQLYNSKLDAEINSMISSTEDTDSEDFKKEIQNLENQKLKVHLDQFNETDKYIAEKQKLLPNIIAKQVELQLKDTEIQYFENLNENQLNDKLISYQDILEKYAEENGKSVAELTEDEIKDALDETITIYASINSSSTLISDLFKSTRDDKLNEIEKELDSFIDTYNNSIERFKQYKDFESKQYETIKAPEFFETTNYALDAVISEIKNSHNLDRELLIKIQEGFKGIIDPIRVKYFKNNIISDAEIFDFMKNIDDYTEKINNYSQNSEDMNLDEAELPTYIENIVKDLESVERGLSSFIYDISNLSDTLNASQKTVKKLTELDEILKNKDKFISNTIYDFIEKFELNLYKVKSEKKNTVMSILKSEELSLFNSSDITNYLSEGIRDSNMQQSINAIRLMKSVILGLSTTEIGFEDPYGFIASRKSFAKQNGLESEVEKLKTLDSATASMMIFDLNRLESKLKFLKELAKSNSGQTYAEQETIRAKMTDLLLDEWKRISNKKIQIQGKPAIPDINEILNSTDFKEKKLLRIEESFFTHNKDLSKEDKIEFIKAFIEEYKYENNLDELYDKNGLDSISKDIKELNKNDMLLYLASNLTLNSKDFNNQLLRIMSGNEFDKSPFYTQELAVKIAYASIVDPDLFAEISKQNQAKNTQLTEYIAYILGAAGTGKTTVVLKSLLLVLKDSNPNMRIWFAAPHQDQANKLQSDVIQGIDSSKLDVSEKFDKQSLFDRLKITKVLEDLKNKENKLITEEENHLNINFDGVIFDIPSDLPNLIFIDEITHFTAIELATMNELVRRAKIGVDGKEGINVKIIGAGDPVQNGATSDLFKNFAYNVDRVSGTFLPQLMLTVRALNSQQRTNNDYIYALTKKSISIFRDADNDTKQVLDLIGNGVLLKYYLNDNTLNGALMTSSDTIPTEVLNTLKNIIAEKPDTKIGILSDTLEINPKLKEALDKVGITENNYKIYTESTVQGSESDYFILNKSSLKGKNILRSLRKLYTFSTRSKFGTIILNDGPIINNDSANSELKLLNEKQDFTENIVPLDPEVVKENTEKRIASLKELLNPDFNVNYNKFKFADTEDNVIVDDEEVIDNIFTDADPIEEKTTEEQIESTKKLKESITDDFNYMIHTFYNDLNVNYKVSERGNNIILKPNEKSKVNYGLNFLFDRYTKEADGSISIGKEEFEKITNDYANLKYAVWETLISKGDFKLPAKDSFLELLLNGNYKTSSYKTELVLVKDIYSELYNSPYAKEGDVQAKHLETGDPVLNMFLKVELNDSEFYYIHLATLPNKTTVSKFFGTHFGASNKSSKAYTEFLKSDQSEWKLNAKQVRIMTSTRMIKNNTKHTLEGLSKMPGLKFFNGSSFTNTIYYNLFPTGADGFDAFKAIYKRSTFGSEISDEKLKEMYFGTVKNGKRTPGYQGKPYAVVSMTANLSHSQVVLLRSETRGFDEILKVLKNPFNLKSPKSAKQLIQYATKGSEEAKRIHNFTDTLFSGSQVLDMLLDLAIEKPELFNKFFLDGTKVLEEVGEKLADNKTFLKEYLSVLSSEFEKDLLTHITYAPKNGEDVLRKIVERVKIVADNALKSGKPLTAKDRENLRSELLKVAKSNKKWFTKFWNFFSFRNTIDSVIANPEVMDDIKTNFKEFGKVMDSMITFWKEKYDNKVYYNVPISPSKGGGYNLSRAEWDQQYLYTNLTPEGLYAMLDLSKEVNDKAGVTSTDTENEAITKLKTALAKVKVNGETILPSEDIDTEKSLNDKIERSKEIKNIIEHNQNTDPESDGFDLENLRLQDLATLKGYSTILDLRNKGVDEQTFTPEEKINNFLENLSDTSPMTTSLSALFNFINMGDEHALRNGVTDDDFEVINKVGENLDTKAFPTIEIVNGVATFNENKLISLDEFLKQIINSKDSELATLFDETDDEFRGILISNMIFDRLGIDISNLELSQAENLFDQCRE